LGNGYTPEVLYISVADLKVSAHLKWIHVNQMQRWLQKVFKKER